LTLRQAIDSWDRAAFQPRREQAEREWHSVRTAFPLNAWPTLDLRRYALGTGEQGTFCWWMEFGMPTSGSIAGGNAQKHLIFKRANGDWYYPDDFRSVEEAWTTVRAELVEAIRLAGLGDFAGIGALPHLQNGSRTVAKAIFTYHPDSLMPVFARGHRDHYVRLFGGDEDGGEYAWEGCHRLLQVVRRNAPELRDWSALEIMHFLYDRFSPIETIVKIAPGPNAELWPDCRDNGYIRVGWEDVGDLRGFASREEFTAAFGRIHPYNGNRNKVSEKAGEVWTLLELRPGDLVLANQGTARIVGIGRVKDPGYQFRPDLANYGHTVAIDWHDTTERAIEPIKRWAFKTVARVSQSDYERILSGRQPGTGATLQGDGLPPPPDPLMGEIERAITRKGQAILYGPPGTGKTYNARRFCVWWLARRRGETDPDSLLVHPKRFRQLEESLATGPGGVGPLTRVTFHPSYSYEDFVEGYKPRATDSGTLDLRLTDGVFKRVCRAAATDRQRDHLLLIDEINRGNIPKIFGELITLLERDKRDVTVVLPQSGESFSVPPNVYLLGTMNTADRSIRLLDAALRRRFAFIELMPDVAPLEGGRVGELDLAVFLAELNRRIARVEGREKQVGHSFLLEDGQPVADAGRFAQQFRHEILPLLQEYAYEDYRELAEYIGPDLVDVEEQRVRSDVLDDPDALVRAPTKHLATGSDGLERPEGAAE
jgi:5-methylcytosine-specific restriction protein B